MKTEWIEEFIREVCRMYKESKGINIVYTLVLSITLILTGYLLIVQVFGDGNDTDQTGQRLIAEDVQPHQTDDGLQTSKSDDPENTSQSDEASPGKAASTEKDAGLGGSGENTVLTGLGRYEGQADSNFIEITVTDDQGNASPRVFQLNETLRERFNTLGLETGDAITFTYEEREGQNPLLHTLEKQLRITKYLSLTPAHM